MQGRPLVKGKSLEPQNMYFTRGGITGQLQFESPQKYSKFHFCPPEKLSLGKKIRSIFL